MNFIDQMADGSLSAPDMAVVPKKQEPMRAVFRWAPSLVDEIDEIAKATGRSRNEAGELLMRWAVERAKHELEMAEKDSRKNK